MKILFSLLFSNGTSASNIISSGVSNCSGKLAQRILSFKFKVPEAAANPSLNLPSIPFAISSISLAEAMGSRIKKLASPFLYTLFSPAISIKNPVSFTKITSKLS